MRERVFLVTVIPVLSLATLRRAVAAKPEPSPAIKAFCIDFNWGPKGIYGFSKPSDNFLPLPIAQYRSQVPSALKGNDRNIAVLLRFFQGLPLDR